MRWYLQQVFLTSFESYLIFVNTYTIVKYLARSSLGFAWKVIFEQIAVVDGSVISCEITLW